MHAPVQVMVTYERKYDALIKEVRGLEGDLADYNLSMDKARTSTVRHGGGGGREAGAR